MDFLGAQSPWSTDSVGSVVFHSQKDSDAVTLIPELLDSLPS